MVRDGGSQEARGRSTRAKRIPRIRNYNEEKKKSKNLALEILKKKERTQKSWQIINKVFIIIKRMSVSLRENLEETCKRQHLMGRKNFTKNYDSPIGVNRLSIRWSFSHLHFHSIFGFSLGKPHNKNAKLETYYHCFGLILATDRRPLQYSDFPGGGIF